MIGWVLKKLATSILSRWVIGGVVALLLGGGVWKWYAFKDGLRDEGVQICVQEINQATMDALEVALADEKSANAALRASLIAAAHVNQEATTRRNELSNQLDSLRGTIEEQRKNDETYRAWADSDLPDGITDRLRQAAGRATGSPD